MYNIELYNRTTRKVIVSQKVATETAAANVVRGYIEQAKHTGRVVHESNYQLSPRCYVFGQTITTTAGIFDISTGKV